MIFPSIYIYMKESVSDLHISPGKGKRSKNQLLINLSAGAKKTLEKGFLLVKRTD